MSEGTFMGLLRLALDRHTVLQGAGRDDEARLILWQILLLKEAAERETDGRPLAPVTAVLCTEPNREYVN